MEQSLISADDFDDLCLLYEQKCKMVEKHREDKKKHRSLTLQQKIEREQAHKVALDILNRKIEEIVKKG